MAFRPSEADQNTLDKFLGMVLDAYKSGEVDRLRAVGVLAHVMTAAAIDNEGEFQKFIRLPRERAIGPML